MTLSQAILCIGLSQSLFAIVVLLSRRDRAVHDLILAACLGIISLKFLIHLLYSFHQEFFDIDFSIGLIPLTFGPMLYLYTRYLTAGNKGFRWVDLTHFIPFVLLTAIYFAYLKDEVEFVDTRFFQDTGWVVSKTIFGLSLFASVMTYTVLTLRRLHRYRGLLVNLFSFRTVDNRLLWVNALIILFAITYLTYFVLGGIHAVMQRSLIDISLLSHIGLTTLAFVTSYFGIKQPSFLSLPVEEEWNALQDSKTASTTGQEETGDNSRQLEAKKAAEIEAALNTYMAEEKPFVNPELTLGYLAESLNVSKFELSVFLNHHLGKNFFQFINEYRTEEVIRKMKDPKFDHLTLQAIAYDSGFKSKSTFNSFFKQHTGMTPSAYRKEHID